MTNLHPLHLADLRKSALSDETILKAGFESIPPDLIVKEIGNYPGINSAYRIPYPETDSFCRYKVFYQEGKTGPKYFQRKGSGNRLYIPEKVRAVLNDPSVPLYFTEGEKKALKACQEGLYCIGVSGLWNWSNGNKQLIPDFDQVDFTGREVFIIPDNDWLKPDKHGYKKNLKQAVYKLGETLIERGAKVFVVLLPKGLEKMGLDDYLIEHTVKEFLKLPLQEVLNLDQRINKATEKELEALLQEIAQEPGESRKTLLIKSLSNQLKIGIRPLQADVKVYAPKGKSSDRKPIACANFPGLVDIVENEKGQPLFLVKELELTLATEIEREGEVYVPPDKKQCRFALGNAEAIKQHYVNDSDHQLYWDIYERLKKVSVLPSESYYHLITVYVFFTYFHEQSLYYPYLWFFGQPERGKSRISKAVTHLSYRGLFTETLNEAFIFRFADRFKGTLGLDLYEISERARNKGSYDLILGRFERGVSVARVTKPDKEAFQDTEYFACWGPTVLATNIEIPVHEPLRSRCLKITMPEARGKYPNNNSGEALAELKNRLLAFRARNFDNELPEVEKPVAGRLGDIMHPLFHMAQLLPPEAKKNLISLIQEFEGERKQGESETLAGRIVQALFELQGEVTNGRLFVKRLREKLNEGVEERFHISPGKIGKELSALGIERGKSTGGDKVVLWETESFKKLFDRYIPKDDHFDHFVPLAGQASVSRVDEEKKTSTCKEVTTTLNKHEVEGKKEVDEAKIFDHLSNISGIRERDRVDKVDEFLNPKKKKFSPLEIEDVI